MKDYVKNKVSSYLQYCDVNHLYGWAMSQKLPVNNFEWIKHHSQFNEGFIKSHSEESRVIHYLKHYLIHLLELDVKYIQKLYERHNDLPFLPKRMKTEKAEKLVANFHDKTEYYIHITNLKGAFQSWISFKKCSYSG